MEIPGVGVQSELQWLAYITAMATWDVSRICDLHPAHSNTGSFNPLSEARDRTHILMDTGWVLHPLSHTENSQDVVTDF